MVLPPSPPLTPSSSPNAASPIKSALKVSTSTSGPAAAARSLPAPPLTPRSSTDSLPLAERSATRHAPTFLDAVYPNGPVSSSSVGVHVVGALPRSLDGVVVDHDTGLRTLYVKGIQRLDADDLRDAVVELLDEADERLDADAVVFVLNKKKPNGLRELLQGLLYVGGDVVRDQEASKDAVLVSIEL